MKSTPMRILVVLLTLALLASTAEAQGRGRGRARGRAVSAAPGPRWGPHVGYNFDFDDALLGVHLSWPITPRIELYPSFDYYFVDPGALWSLNADLKFRPPTRYGAFYFGGGLNYTRFSDAGSGSGDTNVNFLAGLEGRRGRTVPYVEAKLILGDASAFQIVGGFSFR